MATGLKYQVDFAPKRTKKLEPDTQAHVILFISLLFASFVEGFFQSLIHALAHTENHEKKVIYSCDSPGIITTRIHYKAQAAEHPLSSISEDSLCCHTLAGQCMRMPLSLTHFYACLVSLLPLLVAALHSRCVLVAMVANFLSS
jgi:hypothetical protein